MNDADSSSDETTNGTPRLRPLRNRRVRRLSDSHSSQTTPGIYQTPTRDLKIHNIHPTTLLAIEWFRVQLFNFFF